jgi:adenine-specific DNA-methyltransferase
MKKSEKMKLTDNEKRDVVKLIEEGKNLPEKYRFLLFEQSKQIELSWNGKSDDLTNIDLPFQIIEQVDEPRTEKIKLAQSSFDFNSGRQTAGWTNKLIWGDNKYILSSLKNGPMRDEIEKEGGIKLIYIDPPFDVGADFSMNVEVGDNSYEKKPNVLEHIAYRDTWGLGEDSFLSMIYERLILMKDLLAEDGSIYVHCDWRMNSLMRVILDEIFGRENYINEIIWKKGVVKGARANSKKFGKVLDNILIYSKSNNYYFKTEYKPHDLDSKNNKFTHKDKDGRIYSIDTPLGDYSEKKITEFEKQGRIHTSKNGKKTLIRYLDETKGISVGDLWDDISPLNQNSSERTGYPTQKPEKLLERIINCSTKQDDLICDFFAGSGVFASVAEKLNRKWICSDLGKFSIHTIRKRMIDIQRKLKKEEKNWRAFEILNLGKYQRQHYIYDGKSERDEIKITIKKNKEIQFKKLILDAYKATEIDGFKTIHGKKSDNLVSIGPINQPLSRNHVEEVIEECLRNKITSVDILGFEYEMGLFPTIQEEAKSKGLRLAYKQIPMEVFDKRAVSKGEIIFHDVAYIEFKPIFKGKKLSIELIDFAVFYNEDNLNVDENLAFGKSKIIVENGQIIEKQKDKNGIIKENILTKKWYDWIDYWSVDFNYESKPEIIKFKTKEGRIEEEWTGNYVFENEWQSFKGKKGSEKLELKSSEREILSGKTKVAVKVVDIFGNDTMKILQVKI